MTSSGQRETWIDVAKGILIFLVVVGHSVGTGFHLPGPRWACDFLQDTYKVIYTFHMPAFFVLAGVTWSSGKNGFLGYLRKKAFRLLIPYYVFGVLSILLGYLVSGTVASADGYYGGSFRSNLSIWICFIIGNACPLNAPLWFLPCLFAVELIYYPIGRTIKSRCASWVFPLLLVILGFPIMVSPYHITPYWLKSMPMYLAFLSVGHLYVPRKGIVDLKWQKGHRWTFLLISLVLYSSVGYAIPWSWRTPLNYVLHILLAIVGALLVFAIAKVFKWSGWILLGCASMGIMVLHKFPIVALMLKTPLQSVLSNGVWILFSNCFVIVFATLVSLVGVALIQKTLPWALGETRGACTQ